MLHAKVERISQKAESTKKAAHLAELTARALKATTREVYNALWDKNLTSHDEGVILEWLRSLPDLGKAAFVEATQTKA